MSGAAQRRTTTVIAFGVAAVVGGLVVAVAPALVPLPSGVLSALADVAATVFGLGALSLLAGLAAVLRGAKDRRAASPPGPIRRRAADDEPADRGRASSRADPWGSPDRDLEPADGREFDDRLRVAAGLERASSRHRVETQEELRDELRGLAVDAYRRIHGCDRATARRAIEAGTWTADATAAAFLGGEDAPLLPLRSWVRGLVHPNGSVYYRVERTVAALRQLDEDAGADVRPVEVPPATGEATPAADEEPGGPAAEDGDAGRSGGGRP